MRIIMILVLALAACGGSKKSATKAPAAPPTDMKAPDGEETKEGAADKDGAPAPTGADPCQGGEKP